MNWVSYAEDIEELRQENEHYRKGIDGLIKRLRQDTSLHEIHRVEEDLRKLADQLIKRYEQHKVDAQKKFEDAIKFLRDPAVQITEKLAKRTRERNEARAELEKCKRELGQCRSSQARSLNKIKELKKEQAALQKEVERLKDAAYVRTALKGVEPLRRK